jgi:transcriptional accessory protein Tex/SPT6
MLLCKARDIIAEWINENIYVRKQLRLYQRTATVSTKVVKKQEEEKHKSFINISIGQNH